MLNVNYSVIMIDDGDFLGQDQRVGGAGRVDAEAGSGYEAAVGPVVLGVGLPQGGRGGRTRG